MSIIINVEQSPLTISPSNTEHIYTLSSTGYTLQNFKYVVDIYFRPQGLDEELYARLKVSPNSYGRAIMDVGEVVRNFLDANPRFSGETYPYLNYVAEENSIITLADAQKTRDYNAYNLWGPGTKNANLEQLWHISQYRCVVGCEYTSGNQIITDIDKNANYQPDYITIFPGVDNTLLPTPYLPYGTLGKNYTQSPNFFQVDNQGWYYYDLFRHVYQKSGATECHNYTYNNASAQAINFNYIDCDNVYHNDVINPFTQVDFCALVGSVEIFFVGCVCSSYTITNDSFISSMGVNWVDCANQSQSTTLPPQQGLSFCACAGSVTTAGGSPNIQILGSCDQNNLNDNGLCSGHNPVHPCPGPQEFFNAAGSTDCAVTQADGKSFTNVRRRMHHPDCPMIVSFLNGKNDYFTNDIYSIAIRGALDHGDPYTYSAECQNRTITSLPIVEEPVNSTFKMLNFYLPYNVTSGNTLNAIPTNSQKVCFYGTSYNSDKNQRLDMTNATTEILEYWIQPKDCINEPIHVLFMNGRGMWDTYTFGKKNTKKILLDRKNYQKETSLDKQFYARGAAQRGNHHIYETNADYSWECNTWFMTQEDVTIMEELFMSQDVFIITGTTIPMQYCQSCLHEVRLYQYLIPVIIKQNDFVEYKKQYQKIFQYNLTLHYGSVKRFRTQG